MVSQYHNVTLKLQGFALLFAPSEPELEPWVGTTRVYRL
jgi:hypothetical protein